MATSGTRWTFARFDSASRVVVLEQVTTGVLEISQRDDKTAETVVIGAFDLRCKLPAASGAGAPPWEFAWNVPDPRLQSVLRVDCAEEVFIDGVARSRDPQQMVRAVGGKDQRAAKPRPASVRGGYVFALADSDDQVLLAKGARGERGLLSVELAFNEGKKRYRLPLLYPESSSASWAHEEHGFELSFTLKIGDEAWSVPGPTITVPPCEFMLEATKTVAELKTALGTEYGNPAKTPPLYARDYAFCFNESKRIGAAFRQHLASAVQYVNDRIPAGDGFTIDPLEVAAIFLCEGGSIKIRDGIRAKLPPEYLRFDGYQNIGIDSYVTRHERNEGSLRDFTTAKLEQLIQNNRNLHKNITNERPGSLWTTFRTLDLETALQASAALYGHAKQAFARDIADPDIMGAFATKANDLPIHVQYYWGSVYYNCGPETGRTFLLQHGIEWHDIPWHLEDSHEKYKTIPKYNASWRGATYRLLRVKLERAQAEAEVLPGEFEMAP